MLEISKIWNFEEALLFRTLRGEIDPGESESDPDRNFQKMIKTAQIATSHRYKGSIPARS